MSWWKRIVVVAILFAFACVPAVSVRPGGDGVLTVLRVREKATEVVLLGSMTAWRPHRFQLRSGFFELSLDLPPGRYEYRIEVRDTTGVHPVFLEGVEKVDDGFGGENAILRIGVTR